MKKLVLVASLVLATSITLTPLAAAQAVPVVPTCSQALDQLAAARALPAGDVATKQVLLDQATAAQIPLAKAVGDAQKAFDANTDSAMVATLQAALNAAKANAATGQAKITAATAALLAEQKLATDRELAIKNAQMAVDKACKGADGTVTVTKVPTATPTVVIPNSINTGHSA